MNMSKKELVAALRSNRILYGYVKYSDHDGGIYKMVKSDFLSNVLEMEDDTTFSNITVTDTSIYIN